jgi:predicted component of type VI protein secretion system
MVKKNLKEMFNTRSHQENANQNNPEIPPYTSVLPSFVST